MKTFAKVMIALFLVAAASACHKDGDDPNVSSIQKPHWQAVSNPDYTASMTLICAPQDSSETPLAADELAAFINDTCRGVAKLIDGKFYLGISGPDDEVEMELRYFCSRHKEVLSQTISFIPGGRLGSVDEPYLINFSGDNLRRVQIGCTTKQASAAPHRINRGDTQGGETTMLWRAGDQVKWTYQGGSTVLTLSEGRDADEATFTGYTAHSSWDGNLAYPASASYDGSTLSFSIPASQTYVANNFANGLLPLYGELQEEMQQKYVEMNVGASVVCVQLSGADAVNTVSIKTPTTEGAKTFLSGNFQDDGSSTTCQSASGQTITLNCPAVQLTAATTQFYLVLPAVTLPVGTQFSVNGAIVKELKKAVVLTKGYTMNLPVITL